MTNATFPRLILYIMCILISLPQSITTSTANGTSTTEGVCTLRPWRLSGQWGTVYGWWDASDQLDFPLRADDQAPIPSTATATATIITYVDDVTNQTSVHTSMPSNWVPPPTNAEGTQTQVVTYTSANRPYTTTIAFPTIFIKWVETYEITGMMYDPVASTWCDTETLTKDIPIAEPTPQFTAGSEFNFRNGSYGDPRTLLDPKGLMAAKLQAAGPAGFPGAHVPGLLPDHPAFTCKCEDQGPAWGGFITKWMIVSSTVSTSEGPAATHIDT
ncbi:hypothetical protein HJFPF1_05876 [Paramyrothecium foliicola]|nr:hypothetical protein HJFPF1_05876 [Paramyrothecium foliicola]